MKEYLLDILWFTLVFAIPDGSDGWLWRSEFSEEKSRFRQTDLITLRIVKSHMGWVGIEFILLPFAVLLKWDA